MQLDHYEHVVHCLDSLLQDIRYCADDPPMESPSSSGWGQGQQRQCRDRNKFEKRTKMQNACFYYTNETQGVKSMFDCYRWCTPYGTKMPSLLCLADVWKCRFPKNLDSLPAYWDPPDQLRLQRQFLMAHASMKNLNACKSRRGW